ncbi:MAG TPA: serine protease [Elusimicrobia bacterium]|nr:serine protease [Elusimicrobiota bacterium]
MRIPLLTLFSVLLLCPPLTALEERGIYGVDDRLDLYQETAPEIHKLAEASVALFPESYVTFSPDGRTAKLFTESYAQAYLVCPEEPFYDQRVGPVCSGALVGPDTVLTAAHCAASMADCEAVKFVFGFAVREKGNVPASIPASDVYSCARIIASQHYDGADWALIQLDRPAAGRVPVKANLSGKLEKGAKVFVMGYPSGLPLKIAGGASVRDASKTGYFITDLDAYAGSSGSPVFNAETKLLEGVLVRGEADYVFKNGCALSRVCPQDGCSGEEVSKISSAQWPVARLTGLESAPLSVGGRALSLLETFSFY